MATNNSDRNSPGFWMNLFNSFRIAWRLLWDGRVPWSTKIIPVIVILYILSPIDIIPDFIPGLGQIDDVALFLIGVQAFIAMSPRDLVARFRAELNGDSPSDGWKATGDPASAPEPDKRSSTSDPDQRSSASKEVIDG
jgi:uncharacterized membrane protein YkvA (DUF1232 family)